MIFSTTKIHAKNKLDLIKTIPSKHAKNKLNYPETLLRRRQELSFLNLYPLGLYTLSQIFTKFGQYFVI